MALLNGRVQLHDVIGGLANDDDALNDSTLRFSVFKKL